ncbi:MAG: hypothetical protein ACP5C4_05705 [Methanomicrobiales archaeon]
MNLEHIRTALSEKDTGKLASGIDEIRAIPSQKERKVLFGEANRFIGEEAIHSRTPDLLAYITDPDDSLLSWLASEIALVFCQTGDIAWWREVFELSGLFDRKSHQSETMATVALTLVQYGVEHHDRSLIRHAQEALHRITIRKYRSEILIEIVPLLTRFGREEQDEGLLHTALFWLDEVTDASRRARLQEELAMELTALWESQGSIDALTDAIQLAMDIPQKTIRNTVISRIMDRTARVGAGETLGPAYLRRILTLFDDTLQDEFLRIAVASRLSTFRSRQEIHDFLHRMHEDLPESRAIIVPALLRVAEMRTDPWYLELAREWNRKLPESRKAPVEEMVQTALAISREGGDDAVLREFLPDLLAIDPAESGPLLMKVADALISAGDFYSALQLAGHIRSGLPRVTRAYYHLSVSLLTEATVRGRLEQGAQILSGLEWFIADAIIRQSVIEYSRKTPLNEVFRHLPAIGALADYHSDPGRVRLELIRILIDRGFLRLFEPDLLVETAEEISPQAIRDEGLAGVVTATAAGISSQKTQGLLAEALDIVSRIHSQKTRAEVMIEVVEQASTLALDRGEAEIIARMETAVDDLLEPDLRGGPLSRTANGFISFGVEHQDLSTLASAEAIRHRLEGSPWEQTLLDPLIEGYVRAGCLRIRDPVRRADADTVEELLSPFVRAFELITLAVPEAGRTISLSGYVDIMLEYAGTTPVAEFSLPVLLFISEMTGEREQEAMLQRVASRFGSIGSSIDAADGYRVMVEYLQETGKVAASPTSRTIQSRLITHIRDPYDRYIAQLRLLSLCIDAEDEEMARSVCESIRTGIGDLTRPEDRCIALCETAGLVLAFDHDLARSLIDGARTISAATTGWPHSVSLRFVITATIALHGRTWAGEDLASALSDLEEIEVPEEYIRAGGVIMAAIGDGAGRRDLAGSIAAAAETIPDAYLLLTLLHPLKETMQHAPSSIAREIRSCLEAAIDRISLPSLAMIARSLLERSEGLPTVPSLPPGAPGASTVREIAGEIDAGSFTARDMDRLESALLSISSKADRALAYTALFQDAAAGGRDLLSERLLNAAKEEAGAVRPRTRRALVFADIACRIALDGMEEQSRELFENALTEASHISDSAEREEIMTEIEDAARVVWELVMA